MFKIKFVIAIVFILSLFAGYAGFSYYYGSHPSDSPEGEYTFVVESGQDVKSLSEKFERDNVVHNSDLFLLKSKLDSIDPLQQGEYTLNLPADPSDLITQINNNSSEIKSVNSQYNKESVDNVLFREGLTVEEYATILDENGVVDRADFLEYIQSPNNVSGLNYEFLPEDKGCVYGADGCVKYYLEGYLYPDTYSFFVNSTPEQVTKVFLNNFKSKVWDNMVITSNKDFEQAIVMASVLEKETGRTAGITDRTVDEVKEERSVVAGVFFNRLENNMLWQSNPTVTYGTDYKLCERTIDLGVCKGLDDIAFDHKYNTYKYSGYPLGPITNPSFDNIFAVLNPTDSDYLFFVADDTGKTYFASTNAGHEANISKVQQINASF